MINLTTLTKKGRDRHHGSHALLLSVEAGILLQGIG